MALLTASTKARARAAAKSIGGSLIGAATVGMLRTTRYFDPVKTSDFFARVVKLIGPRLREHRIGRANLSAAFTEEVAGGDRADPDGRLGQSRPRRRRVRPYRPRLGL
ncbi:hypothetical protein ACVJ19_005233 [Bradyrhizobium sp. USDA 376]